ncbi:MAG: MoaD family protein [Candidatus Bathyarchaeia archaeon]
MAKVKMLLYATLRKKYKVRELTVECDGTLQDLVEKASSILGREFLDEAIEKESRKLKNEIIFLVNGRNIKDLIGEVTLKEGDIVAVFPPVAGG